MNKILKEIMIDINENREDEFEVVLDISEITSATQVIFKVYNAFVECEMNGMVFTKEMQHFLNSLHSAYEKLNNA